MSETPPSDGSSKERPYGKTPIVLLLFHIVWTFYGNLRAIPDVVGLYTDVEEDLRKGAALSPESLSELSLWRSLAVTGVTAIAAWFVIIALQNVFAYGLWKPKRWARKVGIISLGLGVIVSLVRLLATVAVFTALQLDTAGIARPGIFDVVWDVVAFSAVLWFLSKPEVRDYIKAEGHGYAEPTPPAVEEEIEPEPVPLEEAEVEPAAPVVRVEPEETLPRIARIPDTIRGKRPESVAWIAEDKCKEEIFLDGDHLIIVKSPDEPAIDIPIKDIVKLERGEMNPYAPGALDVLRGMGLLFRAGKISELKITYMTKPGLMSTVTLFAERRICPRCGGKLSLVAAGLYCMKDDLLLDPATNDLVQMIESKRSQKTSKKDVIDRRRMM